MTTAPTETLTVAEFLASVRDGRWQTRIEKIRSLAADLAKAIGTHGADSAEGKESKRVLDAAKKKLPGVTLAGRFEDRDRGATPIEMSGFVAADLDGLLDPEGAKRLLGSSPFVVAAWLSCSGRGLWVLAHTVPAPTAGDYSAAWAVLVGHVADVLGLAPVAKNESGKAIFDPSVKNVSRLCFASYDEALWLNIGAEPLPILGNVATERARAREDSSEPLHLNLQSTSCTLHTALGSADNVLARMDADARAATWLESLPPLVRNAYRRHFDRHFVLAHGTRNSTLTIAAPALVRRLSFDVALSVLMAFYDLYREWWNDPRARHEREAIAVLKNATAALVAAMPDREHSIYERLSTETRRAAFRIARDLALINDRGDACAFFLSECELASRIDVSDSAARETLQDFARWGILTLLERGERRMLGKQRRATRWKWMLTVEDASAH